LLVSAAATAPSLKLEFRVSVIVASQGVPVARRTTWKARAFEVQAVAKNLFEPAYQTL